MFELLKSRAEELDKEKFNNFLEDSEFKTLIAQVENKMSFESSEEDQDSVFFEPEEGYKDALRYARDWLDKKGVRVSDSALAKAIARKLDPEGKEGYVGLV